MLGQFTWENKANCGLDFTTSDGGGLIHAAKLGGFVGNLIESIGDEVVHDGNTFLGDASVWVHLLQDLEDIVVEGTCGLALAGDGLLHGLSHNE